MHKIPVLMVAAALAFPAVASAKDYATAGVIEVGGAIGFSSTAVTQDVDAPGAEATTTTTTSIELSPEVTYFLMDQLGLVGALVIDMNSTDFDGDATASTNTIGLQVGAQYLFPVSNLHVGPDVRLGFMNIASSNDFGGSDSSSTTSGPAISIGGVAKVPFGGGGVLGVGLGLDMLMGSTTTDPDAGVDISTTVTDIGLSTSFTVFW